MRLFVAFEMPPSILEAGAAIQRELKKVDASVGWVRLEGMHLTLKFLGEVSQPQQPDIEKALGSAAVGSGPVKVAVRGVGVFPSPKNPRVIWLGIEARDERLSKLQARIEQSLSTIGFRPEEREFRPHLTLGRVRSSRGLGGLMKAVANHQAFLAGDCVLDRLHLIQSELHRGGAVYTKLWSVAL